MTVGEEQVVEHGELGVATDQSTGEQRRRRHHLGAGLELRVIALRCRGAGCGAVDVLTEQHLLVQSPQRCPRVYPELLGQHAAHPLEDLQRLSPAPGSGQGAHRQCVRPLVVGLLPRE
ncbi:hypothetical protein FXB39_05540 [Nocardioides sp. BGMRC 2183]|nr:hypothetical protein FXB39_05540 [Nocardioides sp. BGMRC 2183]